MDQMDRQEDKALWDLLGKGREPRVPGNFADNVLRSIRQAKPDEHSFRLPIWLRWASAPLLAGGVTLLFVNVQPTDSSRSIPSSEIAAITETAGQLAVNDLNDAAHLDDLLDNNDENTVWLGTASF